MTGKSNDDLIREFLATSVQFPRSEERLVKEVAALDLGARSLAAALKADTVRSVNAASQDVFQGGVRHLAGLKAPRDDVRSWPDVMREHVKVYQSGS